MMDDSDFNLNETRSEPVETAEASKEFEIPPALPSDYSARPSNSFEHIVDANQKSLTTTSWGNSVHDSSSEEMPTSHGTQADNSWKQPIQPSLMFMK